MSIEDILIDLRKQRIASGIETFVLIDGIGPRSVLKVRSDLKGKRGQEIDVILHSGGGSPDDAYRLIRSFREHYDEVNIIVPFWAKSAATLIALGATKIVMQEYGELGPIDTQIRKNDEEKPREEWESALNIQASLLKIEELSNSNFETLFTTLQNDKNINLGRKQLAEMLLSYNSSLYAPLLQRIEVYEMGRMERYLNIGKMYARRIIQQYGVGDNLDQAKIEEFLDFLTYECPDHGYVIDYGLLTDFLPNVIRSSDEPYGPKYDEMLETLSYRLMLMARDFAYVGFVSDLEKPDAQKNEKNDNLDNEKKGQISNDSRSDDKAEIDNKKLGSKSTKNDGAKESSDK